MSMQFRLTFDVPYSFAVESGYTHALHCHDFRQDAILGQGTWQCPVTKIVMLQPSFLRFQDYASQFQPLDNWNYVPGYWVKTTRSTNDEFPGYPGWSTILPAIEKSDGTYVFDVFFKAILNIGIIAIEVASTAGVDGIAWLIQSKFTLVDDEAFGIYYHHLTDQMAGMKKWLAWTWDNLQIHVDTDGICRVFQWADRAMLGTLPPVLIDRFEIANPTELAARDGYFILLPIPGQGIVMYHNSGSPRMNATRSSASDGVARGHLIRLPTEIDSNNLARVTRASKIALGLNIHPGAHQHIAFKRVVFDTATSHAWINAPFVVPYTPTAGPSAYRSLVIPNGHGTASSEVRRGDNSGTWASPNAGTTGGSKFRVSHSLSTDNASYTPFLIGEFVQWNPSFALPGNNPNTVSRNTTPTAPDVLQRLEMTDTYDGRFEGEATVLMQSDTNIALCERGDASWLIEKSADGVTWATHAGGLARLKHCDAFLDNSGFYYLATWKLNDLWQRFEEITNTLNTAFDGVTPGAAINVVLGSSGFPGITSLPAGTDVIALPNNPTGSDWRFGAKMGDTGADVARQMLLLLRKQYLEWRLRYDFANVTWVLEQRARDATTMGRWVLTPYPDELIVGGSPVPQMILVGGGKEAPLFFALDVQPPEANVLVPFGLTSADPQGTRIPGEVITNQGSVDAITINGNPNPDYLGRVVIASPMFGPLSDVAEINKMGRRVEATAMHRHLMPVVTGDTWVDAFVPNTCVDLRGENAARQRRVKFSKLWLKQRTAVLDYLGDQGVICHMTYRLDSIWEGDIK